ncbi:hypothetical protein CVT24_012413 [Panaeolus cyanescens]|uniref:G domain-containing protein n=1 Tax=Panaeolus cyanescens TaxID=181874 RepID=A0A409YJE1_9AGAR|nr:hypothetical protein CVT24_012413 [Panaeolus cyanescens]
MPKKSGKPSKGKGPAANLNILNFGTKRAAVKSIIHLFFVGDKDVGISELVASSQKDLRIRGSKPSTPISPTRPSTAPTRDFQIHGITVPDGYDFEAVAKALPNQINGSTYNAENTAIVYFMNINRDVPPSIPSSFVKAAAKKCHPSRFFWITAGWSEDDRVTQQQKSREFELRNVILRPTIQRGFQLMRLVKGQGYFVNDVMASVEDSLSMQEGTQKGWRNKIIDTVFGDAFDGKEVGIDDLTATDIIIAVMGPTGAGKSTFIKTVSGYDVKIGHTLDSCTSEVSIIRFRAPQLTECNIALVDTPGFDDTNKSDLEIFRMIADWLDKTFKRKILLDGVLYLHRISDNRMAGTPYKNYQMFERLCGKSSFKQVILVTTMWGDESEHELHEKREEELRKRFWSHMLRSGSTMARFDETAPGSGFRVLAPIVSNASAARQGLTLQKELNDFRLALPETSAGRVMYTKLEVLLMKQKRILEDLKKDIEAEQEGDGPTVGEPGAGGSDVTKMLKEEYEGIEQEMKTIVADLQEMRLSVPSRLLTSLKSTFRLRFSF